MLEVQVCGALEVRVEHRVLPEVLFGGRQGRLVFAFLVCERHRAVPREELADLLWPDRLPDSWSASLSAVISRLRRLLGEAGLDGPGALVSSAGSYRLLLPSDATVDLEDLVTSVEEAERAAQTSDVDHTLAAATTGETIAARGFLTDDCEWVDRQRATVLSLRVRAALAQSVAHLAAGASGRAVEGARDALALDPSREESYRQLMRALGAAGERGEALRVWERCRVTLAEELGVDPAPETERVYLEILGATAPPAVTSPLPSGVVTFLLTDIVESSAMWEAHTAAMAEALERHDTIVGAVVTDHGGTLLKSKLEGDATVSVFARATECAAAALALLDALANESWPEETEPRLRMAMHTGEAFERGGDYFGPALNRAARLRSLAGAGEVLLSQAVSELVRDDLPTGVVLRDRGHRDLRGLSRGENVYELARATGPAARAPSPEPEPESLTRPPVPGALAGTGPFVGRSGELARLGDLWTRAVAGDSGAVFVGGEPGVGKSRLAGELAVRADADGALVLYGRCDEDLDAPLQPFIEAVRTLVPALGATRLRSVRGIDLLHRFVPVLGELLGEQEHIARADPDTERLALFDAVTQLLGVASSEAPVLLVLDDLHWAGKTTLSLLRHLLRGATDARLLIVGTYRDTELARTHPLAATLADLRRDAGVERVTLGGLGAVEVDAYLAAIGNDDRELGRELAALTSGNPFFLIEVLRHIADAGGVWDPGSLPEGVREATGRRLSRLSGAANDALAVAAVVGTRFDLALVEQVQGADLVDEIAEASRAGLVVEEPGTLDGFRFAHALVRRVLLAELVTLKRVRLHRRIAELLEAEPTVTDPDAHLADLAHHWFECASAGGARQAVEACRRAADRAMERLAYEEAGDLYGMALQALDSGEDADPDARAALHLARCDASLTAGDVAGARDAVDALEAAASGSERLAAWYTIYEGMLAVLAEPDRLTAIVSSIGAAADAMHAVGDLAGEAKAHHVHASALERLGQIGAAERALDAALAAARTSGDRRLADAILAEAPPAALWGPSPIARASGRCLDVIRVLRITDGAPAVEAVALRCQAVLEALRGRTDAAHRMIATARRTVEQLGLTHRRLETDVAAGFIDLLGGRPAEAESHLGPAFQELRSRGLDGEAAQAAAFLGRALLRQGRVDEAEAVAAEAQQLAGADLKAAIAWRDVRAEAAARRGDTETALVFAREAVHLASATDALLLVGDARLTLSEVLRTTGDDHAADAEAQRAVEACEAKGATVLAARARTASRAANQGAETTRELAEPHVTPVRFENDATRRVARGLVASNAGDFDALRAGFADDWLVEDRRSIVGMPLDHDQSIESVRVIHDTSGSFELEVIATRGRSLAAFRRRWHSPGFAATVEVLSVHLTNDARRLERSILFEPDDVDAALVELDRLYRKGEGAEHADVLDLVGSLLDALERRDASAVEALLAPGFVLHDHRDRDQQATDLLELWGGGRCVEHVAELRSDGGLWAVAGVGTLAVRIEDGCVSRIDCQDAGTVEHWDPTEWFANSAWRVALRMKAASDARSWDAYLEAIGPEFEHHDNRAGLQIHATGHEALDYFRAMFDLDEWSFERTLLATRDDRLALVHDLVSFTDGVAGLSEVEVLTVIECDDQERITASASFDVDDLPGAFDELDRRHTAQGGNPLGATMRQSFAGRDWTTFAEVFSPACTFVDHRTAGWGPVDRAEFVEYQRGIVDLAQDARIWIDHSRTTGTVHLSTGHVAGTRDGGGWEITYVTVGLTGWDGRGTLIESYELADMATARTRFDELVAAEREPFANAAWRAAAAQARAVGAKSWEAYAATLTTDTVIDDRRSGIKLLTRGGDATDVHQSGFMLDRFRMEDHLLATRGEHLALVDTTVTFEDGAAGPAELRCLKVLQVDNQGLLAHMVTFDPDDHEGAYHELDDLYVALGEAREVAHTFDTRDWQAFAELFESDFVGIDRRHAGWGRQTRDSFVELWREGTELAPDARIWVDHARSAQGIDLVVTRHVGTRDGGFWELPVVSISAYSVDGKIEWIEAYDLEDLAVARSRFDELVAAREQPAIGSPSSTP